MSRKSPSWLHAVLTAAVLLAAVVPIWQGCHRADPPSAPIPRNNTQAVRRLDALLADRDSYLRPTYQLAESIRRQAVAAPPAHRGCQWLRRAEVQMGLNLDSAYTDYSRAYQCAVRVGDSITMLTAGMYASAILPALGLPEKGLRLFQGIEPEKDVPPALRLDYYRAAHRLYGFVRAAYPQDSLRRRYRAADRAAIDSLVALLPSASPEHAYYRSLSVLHHSDRAVGRAAMRDLLDSMAPDNHFYAMAAGKLADLADEQRTVSGDPDDADHEATYYNTLAAIAYIQAGERDPVSLYYAGIGQYLGGDTERANTYILASYHDARAMGAYGRLAQVGWSLPYVSKGIHELDRTHWQRQKATIVGLCVAALVAVALLLVNRRALVRTRRLKTSLQQALQTKDAYIQDVMAICDQYIARLEDFSLTAARKLRVGQGQDLLRSIDSGKAVQEQTQRLLEVLDRTFLKSYPRWLQDVNALLKPDQQLPPAAESDRLTTELRLLALIRLGIDDAQRLARFMGLSLNTVYAYRNRLRNRALDRDTFEASIRAIGTVPDNS